MAAEVLKHPNFENFETDDFFEVALEEGFTKQGEMFWAEDLSKLAELVLNCESKVIYGNINENWPVIAEHLMKGIWWETSLDFQRKSTHDQIVLTRNYFDFQLFPNNFRLSHP